VSIRLYVWQRLTAALMAPLVIVHVAVIFYASRKGLSAADILARTRGSFMWASFYCAFVLAASIHAAIGVREVCVEWSSFTERQSGILGTLLGCSLLLLGLRAVAAVVAA
jgi:fumarate reductase subunit C